MINISKYDIVIVKFPFASSLKYKARPAIVISNDMFNNKDPRKTLIILAISSQINSKTDIEPTIKEWESAGLLKESIFKSAIVTIEDSSVLTKIGTLQEEDIFSLEKLLKNICK